MVPGEYKVSLAKRVNGVATEVAAPVPFKISSDADLSLKGSERPALADYRRKVSRLQMAVMGATEVIDSLTAQKRVVEIGFGLALLPKSSIQEELRLGTLAVIDAPRLRATIPVAVVHRRNGYLSGAAKALLALVSAVPITLARPGAAAPPRRRRKPARKLD